MSAVENAKKQLVEVPVNIPTLDGKGVAETIMAKVEGIKDPKTGELFLDGNALEALDKIKARHMGLLTPEEIKQLRTRLDLTQLEMSNLLRIGEKTYTRWESGKERPSQALNLLLRALWDGRLDVAYLSSKGGGSFNWQDCLELSQIKKASETTPAGSVEFNFECAANEQLALAA